MWGCFSKLWRSLTPEKQKPLKINEALDWIIRRIDRIESKTNLVLWHEVSNRRRTRKLMATLDDLVAAAAEEDTKIDSLIALVVTLKEKIDAIPGITPEQQAKIDAAFASITDNPQRIQDAIDANTPAP